MRKQIVFFSLILIFFSPLFCKASDVDLERDLQNDLEQSRLVIEKIQQKLKKGSVITAELRQLKTLSEDIKASHLLLQERFRLREDKVIALGTKALERHRAMSEGYRKAIEEYLSLIDSLALGSDQKSAISSQQMIINNLDNLNNLLDKILHKNKRPIFGSLPYKNLNYPSREPNTEPSIKPAYKGGTKEISPDDLKSTLEAPISQEIAALSQSLNWNPVSIYEYVKNNIETEWYWGCMKGAEETLRQKSGNDCDQAALLISLLRASGFPSRYTRGVIEFFPDIEKVKNLTGIDDPSKIAEFFQKAGIPYKPVIAGGKIINFQVEHIWVESQIPYANYRGAILDEHGKTWLGLDTFIKTKGYTYNNPVDIIAHP
ncbi:MAG: transglutaminase domain-containing protein, partial [Nitrospira sp.]|nr:transglutaminase domain-containing protein [Nitrospira sp.]